MTGREPPKGINTFEESELHQVCIDNLRRAKYKTPTPIQKSVLPAVCAGRDVMACAQTGSGKTVREATERHDFTFITIYHIC